MKKSFTTTVLAISVLMFFNYQTLAQEGCTNSEACNYEPMATSDDGSCCLGSCTTVEITDSFGNGSGSFEIYDELINLVASGSLDNGFSTTYDFCIPPGCYYLLVYQDGFPDEMGLTLSNQFGVIYEELPGDGINANPFEFGLSSEANVNPCTDWPGCLNPNAINYQANATADCLEVVGGTDESCCLFYAPYNDCDGATVLTPGLTEDWDSSLANYSGNNCSPTLQADVWFSYTPECDQLVTISSSSIHGGELAVWQGDCSINTLSVVECSPNYGTNSNTIQVMLSAGVTYHIQTGSNSDMSVHSTGTILLTTTGCDAGCTDAEACNYSTAATINDGSCLYPFDQCYEYFMQIEYRVYNSDCSCVEPLLGDYNYDMFITSIDLSQFLSEFGETVEFRNPGDFNEDGQITSGDLSAFLALFGSGN